MDSSFTEKDFYLAEYHGRTLAMAIPAGQTSLAGAARKQLIEVLEDLSANRIRILVLSDDSDVLADVSGGLVLDASEPGWIGSLWRGLQGQARLGLMTGSGEELASFARRVCLRLQLAKLVWLSDAGAIRGCEGERISLIDLAGLDARLAAPGDGGCPGLLREIHAMISGGLPSVSICEPSGLADELYTYAGSGTFFSRERYVEVRNLALDEFSAAAHLIARGVEEGYLVARSPQQIEATLGSAFGAFVEGRYLAGICALLHYPADRAGEISSLYALTRFLGEGVGGHLVKYALASARERGDAYVFACTTSERAERSFQRSGFETVERSDLPSQKWRDYSQERIAQVRCLRCNLR